ncbi:MAG: 30S ribosomal protein S7, partial [Candidatus Thermoplasmatota archaeon]|nr:30S ribosomal protein S7 [Candidatus Thermoplasmatota archaeon]
MTEKSKEKVDAHFFPVLAKYDMSKVKVEDRGLERYINLETENLYLGGVFSNKMFAKAKVPIVERLINNIMRTEVYTGKKIKAYKVIKAAFEIIEKRTKSNPIQVFVDSL